MVLLSFSFCHQNRDCASARGIVMYVMLDSCTAVRRGAWNHVAAGRFSSLLVAHGYLVIHVLCSVMYVEHLEPSVLFSALQYLQKNRKIDVFVPGVASEITVPS